MRAEVARLTAEGIDDPALRMARLLPMLRARREFQNTAPGTNSMCLRPNGGFGPRRISADAPAGSSILVMSDGFYRLVDTYHLHTPESLFALCIEHGVQAALDELRSYEAAAQASYASGEGGGRRFRRFVASGSAMRDRRMSPHPRLVVNAQQFQI